jgi:hypothetical protein
MATSAVKFLLILIEVVNVTVNSFNLPQCVLWLRKNKVSKASLLTSGLIQFWSWLHAACSLILVHIWVKWDDLEPRLWHQLMTCCCLPSISVIESRLKKQARTQEAGIETRSRQWLKKQPAASWVINWDRGHIRYQMSILDPDWPRSIAGQQLQHVNKTPQTVWFLIVQLIMT